MAEWEYATIWYHKGANYMTGEPRWSAEVTFPGSVMDIRDDVPIEDVLNQLGTDGWELVSEMPGPGIHGRDYRLKRAKP